MDKATDTSSIFRILTIIIVFALLVTAALVFFAPAREDSGAAELAALSQAIPTRAEQAIGGTRSFDALAASLERAALLRRNAGSVPGSNEDWTRLEADAAAVLAARQPVEALHAAGTAAIAAADTLLGLSDALLSRTSATAIVQELQQRAARIATSARGLAASRNPVQRAEGISEDAAFLRNVANALAGEASTLDMRPLNEEGRDTVLAPLVEALTVLETQAEVLQGAAGQAADLAPVITSLRATAARLLDDGFASPAADSPLPGFLAGPWLPLLLIALALALVLAMLALHTKSAVFERQAQVQAEQNDRNQQAILRLLDEMGSLADGDLTVEATVTEDITGTIADSFNYAIEELRKLVATVNETAIMVDSAAKQTESTAAHMARAAENQTREINAATESIVSMAASIEEVSGNAERSSDVARHSVDVAHKGGEAVRRTIDGMNAIRETIQETSKRIKRLGESSQEIGNIVELINDIAEQTNILALNASIQASMAGEAGRGFAVVADEVQRLAERSTNATRQIEVLVRTIQADTKEAVVSMERSTTDVVGGALLAENAGAALDEIEQVSNQIASLVQNISSSARQQAGAAADVTRRTKRLGEISQQTGKATTATAAAISKLSEFASQLRKSVAGFTLPTDAMPAQTLRATPAGAPPGNPAPKKASAG
ncbi:MAG TPA: methyl-accepting chemotaxis protein [Woeseiaceae bacterium]|nr:methyl-accepting chemotaxis protein [Woeseiaceae bacterium]